MSIFPSVFEGYFLGFSHLPFIFTLDSEVGLIGHCENAVRYARPQKYLVNCMGGVKIQKSNIQKLIGILIVDVRIDNPSNGFESCFLESYDPPIQFHR